MLRRNLHKFLIRLFSIATLVLIPVGVALIISSFRSVSQEIRINAEREARIVAVQESRVFEGIRNTLVGISRFAEVYGENTRDCDKTMALLLGSINNPVKQFSNIGIADFKGDIICSAIPLSSPVNISDRDYFRRAVATRNFSFGKYQIGRVTGQPAMNFGYPIVDETSSVRFVAFAALDLKVLNESIGKARIPGDFTLTVTDEDNNVLVVYPRADDLIGKQWGADILKGSNNDEGSAEGLDFRNIPRIFGFSRIGTPNSSNYLHAIVGISISEFLNEFPLNFSPWAVLLLALVVLAAALGWFLAGRIIKHLSSGDV